MDPVQKAVISHTFGVPTPLKKKLFISCNICHLRFNSAVRGRSGNKPRRRLGRERAGDGASGAFPAGKGGTAKGLRALFSIPGGSRGTHSISFIHPLLCPECSAPSFPSPPGTPCPFPVLLSRAWVLLHEKRRPLPSLGRRAHPVRF